MTKILQKRKVGKRGAVVQYGSGISAGKFFYRELIPGTENYRTRSIPEVETLDDACAEAFDIAQQIAAENSMLTAIS